MLQMADSYVAAQSANSIFQLQRQLFARSERVKGIDFHPLEPWILTTLYNGTTVTSPTLDERANVFDRSRLHLVV